MASNSSTSSQLTSDHQQHGGGGGDDSNPGRMLASAVDAEMARYRTLQSELDQLHRDLQVVRGQETETELVAAELAISQKLDESVYKLVGPALSKMRKRRSRPSKRGWNSFEERKTRLKRKYRPRKGRVTSWRPRSSPCKRHCSKRPPLPFEPLPTNTTVDLHEFKGPVLL